MIKVVKSTVSSVFSAVWFLVKLVLGFNIFFAIITMLFSSLALALFAINIYSRLQSYDAYMQRNYRASSQYSSFKESTNTLIEDIAKEKENVERIQAMRITGNTLRGWAFSYPLPKNLVTVSSLFRANELLRRGRLHGGIDIISGIGTPVYAIDDGEVVYVHTSCTKDYNGTNVSHYAYPCNQGGNQVTLKHTYDGKVIYTRYLHLHHTSSSIGLKIGDKVLSGDILGYSGNSGKSTGPHLHFEVNVGQEKGNEVDPITYLIVGKLLYANDDKNQLGEAALSKLQKAYIHFGLENKAGIFKEVNE